MSRMLPIEGANRVEVQTTSGGFTTYPKQRDGSIVVDDPKHREWLRREGLAIPGNEGGTLIGRSGGFTCPNGHENYFRTCGRCGQEGVPTHTLGCQPDCIYHGHGGGTDATAHQAEA